MTTESKLLSEYRILLSWEHRSNRWLAVLLNGSDVEVTAYSSDSQAEVMEKINRAMDGEVATELDRLAVDKERQRIHDEGRIHEQV